MLTGRTPGGAVVLSGLLLAGGCALSSTTAIPGKFLDTNEPLTVEFQEDASDFFTSRTTVIVLSDGARCYSKSAEQEPAEEITNVICDNGQSGTIRFESRTVTKIEKRVLESGATEEVSEILMTYAGQVGNREFKAVQPGTLTSTTPAAGG